MGDRVDESGGSREVGTHRVQKFRNAGKQRNGWRSQCWGSDGGGDEMVDPSHPSRWPWDYT